MDSPGLGERYLVLLAEARMANARANERDAELTKLRRLVVEYVESYDAWYSAWHEQEEEDALVGRLEEARRALRGACGR